MRSRLETMATAYLNKRRRVENEVKNEEIMVSHCTQDKTTHIALYRGRQHP